jgi:oxygen-independent coproporphyrinogen-3 oxidase
MEPPYLKEITDHIKKNFNVAEDAEITMETNPGTVDNIKLRAFRETGINRISIGIQSFDDAELKFLTRIHNSQTAQRTVHLAHENGFDNISIDLIFNLPGQTKEKWQHNLETAITLPIKHISAYSLILENGTILNTMVLDGKVKMQNDDYDADLYEFTIDFLTQHGFAQYEVSNFARDRMECIHNNAYWRYKDYLSFGTSAHSFMDGKRWWNYSPLTFYNSAIEKTGNAIVGEEILTANEMLEEYIMLAFRSKGLDVDDLKIRFGNSWLERNNTLLNQLFNENFLFRNNNIFSFTAKGYAVCDEILSKFS